MSQTKHTPGPWTAEQTSCGVMTTQMEDGSIVTHTRWHIRSPDGRHIGDVMYSTSDQGYGGIKNYKEAEANAHIMGAADDLLSALIKAVESVNNNNVNRKYSDYVIPDWYFGATDAIEKALNFKTSHHDPY